MPSARLTAVVVLALLELAGAAASIASYRTPIGTYGFLLRSDEVTIAVVGRESPAERAAIVPGDRLIYATLPLRGRRFAIFEEDVPGGAPISFEIVHDGRGRWVTLRAAPLPAIGQIETLTYAGAGLAFGLVGLLLVLLRPSRMTWAFAIIAPVLLVPSSLISWSQQNQSAAGTAFDIGVALLYAIQTGGIMLFASRFPNDDPRGVARVVDRLALPAAVVVAAVYLYLYLTVRFSLAPPVHWISLVNYAVLLPAAAALLALVATYAATSGGDRTRLLPVILSFVVLIVVGVLQQLGSELTANESILFALNLAFSSSPALVAGAVAYGVIRHRVMDVSFIISRTLVYTILTLGAVATFALIEYVFGKLLERQGVATLLNILAAVGLGVSLSLIHRRLDGWIDRVLFRRRHLVERRLAASARALPLASEDAAIDAALADEPADALGLASAAVFRREGNFFRRVRSQGWRDGEAAQIDRDDPMALRLQADLEPLDANDVRWPRSDLPTGKRQIIYAVPAVVGYRLQAFALYGAHATGEDLDPDERRALRNLVRAAATGYDHVATQELRRRLACAESENAVLRAVERKLTELLEQRLS